MIEASSVSTISVKVKVYPALSATKIKVKPSAKFASVTAHAAILRARPGADYISTGSAD